MHEALNEEGYALKAVEYYQKGSISSQFGYIDSALIFYDMAIQADKNYPSPHQSKSSIFWAYGEYDKSIKEQKLAIKKDKDNEFKVLDLYFLGMKYDWIGDFKNAKKYYLEALEVLENAKPVADEVEHRKMLKSMQIFLYTMMEDKERAQESLTNFLHEYPDRENSDRILTMNKDEILQMHLAKPGN